MPSSKPSAQLSILDHDRYAIGFRYVYPVVSRRAGGVSVGVNLNPNDACNWRCVYCQVPGLKAGIGPEIDLAQLRRELTELLTDVVQGDFLMTRVPEGSRRLNDVAFSGNGEPTTSPQFGEALEVVGDVLGSLELLGKLKVVLITNGTMVQKPRVQQGLTRLASLGGEIWLKVDRATSEGSRRVNSVAVPRELSLQRLESAATRCPTWIQTCLFAWDGVPPSEAEKAAYLGLIRESVKRAIPLQGVHLYGLARASHQPESVHLSPLEPQEMQAWAADIEAAGLPVRLSALT